MNGVTSALLAAAVVLAWIAVAGFLRLRTPFEYVHAVTFANVTVIGLIVIAAFVTDGISSRSLKCALIWLVAVTAGALLSHATGRALYLREGERR